MVIEEIDEILWFDITRGLKIIERPFLLIFFHDHFSSSQGNKQIIIPNYKNVVLVFLRLNEKKQLLTFGYMLQQIARTLTTALSAALLLNEVEGAGEQIVGFLRTQLTISPKFFF